MFEDLLDKLRTLDQSTLQLKAEGEYPVTARTKVASVAYWQNDGTERIKPSHFVERAAQKNRHWQKVVFDAVSKFLNGAGLTFPIEDEAGMRIAFDISNTCDRIRTGRLKKSFRPDLRKDGKHLES